MSLLRSSEFAEAQTQPVLSGPTRRCTEPPPIASRAEAPGRSDAGLAADAPRRRRSVSLAFGRSAAPMRMRLLVYTLFLGAFLIVPNVVLTQGQFYINNRDTTADVNARFVLPTDPPGTSSVGTNFQVRLFGGPDGSALHELIPLYPDRTTFRGPAGTALAGFVQPAIT